MPTDENELIAWAMAAGAAFTELIALLISPDVTTYLLAGLVVFATVIELLNR